VNAGLFGGATPEAYDRERGGVVKYGIAWLLGIPFVLIIVWFLFDHM
jgi:hypothetical protein